MITSSSSPERHNLEYLISIIITLTFASLYGILEYYWIITNRDVPFRYGNGPIFLGFQLYHIAIMLPILFIVGFSPFLGDWLGTSAKIEKIYTAPLGFATTIFAVMWEDIVWFLCRVLKPSSIDSMAGMWIQPSDWTARWSSIPIPGGAIPTWYFIISAISISLWIVVFRHLTRKSFGEFSKKFVRGMGFRLNPKISKIHAAFSTD